jgi:hypothetical protein
MSSRLKESPRPDEVVGNDAEARPVSAAPVCITGMHRSGTSMVTRLLKDCGLFLGAEGELAGPALDNSEGFWENLNFVGLNEDILARFGGSWDAPPAFPPRWEFGPVVEPLLGRAGELVARFDSHRHWGWKDPRNSLTIPFWRRIIPTLKFVVCVRNPLEVAHSLFVRGDSAGASQFRLWLHYYRQILSAAPPSSRIVTHYHSYFEDARAEVRRVAGWLSLDPSDETAERARAQVSGALRHHHVTTDELKAAGASDEVVELYLRLCDEAGPICRRLLERESRPGASDAPTRHPPAEAYALQLMRLDNQLAKGEERLHLLERQYASLEAQLHEVSVSLLEAQLRHEARLHKVSASLLPLMRALDALRAVRDRLRSIVGGRSS